MEKKNQTLISTLCTALAYAMWGMLTVFWNLLGEVDPVTILAYRILWSMVFMLPVLLVLRRMPEVSSVFQSGRRLLLCFVCGVLVTINWGVYIYAVNAGHVLDASLGYFIEPVLVGLIGLIAFREKPGMLEKITFVFSVVGLVYIVVRTGTFPTMSLLIGGSFAIYGAFKKKLSISPECSLFMETLCMTPFALAYAVYAEKNGIGGLGVLNGAWLLLIPACGVVTSVPLLLFNKGVKKIPYYFSGILMYINPTLQFLMGTFYFKEEIDTDRLIAFIIIWVGIGFTVADKLILAVRERKKAKRPDAPV